MKTIYQFWMIWSPQGGAPTTKHGNFERAVEEARRLSMKCPGKEFYVLRSVKGFIMPAPEEIGIDDGIPF